MYDNTDQSESAICSFCGKSEHQVKSMISGPGVYICNECVELAQSIISEENKVSVRSRKDGDMGQMNIEEFKNKILQEIKDKK